MRPQFAFKDITGPKGLRAPSRCQRVWQWVLILATLALALASEPSLGADAPLVAGPGTNEAVKGLSARHQLCLKSLTGPSVQPQAEEVFKKLRYNSATRFKILSAILTQREQLVRQDLNQARTYLGCLSNVQKTPVCLQTYRQMKSLNEKAKMARTFLGASQSQYQWATWQGHARYDINASLSTLGSYKVKAWKPLTFEERGIVDEALRTIQSDIQKDFPSQSQAADREAKMIEARYSFFVEYLSIMSQSSLLQWIQDAQVGSAQFKTALQEAIKVGERDLSQIQSSRSAILANSTRLETYPSLNTPVLYSSLAKAFSIRNEALCWPILKMKDEYQDDQFKKQIFVFAASLPLMFIPGPGAVIALTLISAAYLANSQTQYLNAKARELGTPLFNWGEIDLKALREARRTRDIDALSVVIGMPLLKGGSMVLKTSMRTIGKMGSYRSILLKRVSGGVR